MGFETPEWIPDSERNLDRYRIIWTESINRVGVARERYLCWELWGLLWIQGSACPSVQRWELVENPQRAKYEWTQTASCCALFSLLTCLRILHAWDPPRSNSTDGVGAFAPGSRVLYRLLPPGIPLSLSLNIYWETDVGWNTQLNICKI